MEKSPQDLADILWDQAQECLDDYDYKRALAIGRKLKKMRHTSAFEIMALAFAGKGKLNKAIEVLEEGVEKAPSVWRLWQLLGSYYSDKGNYEKCYSSYEKALSCPSPDADSIHYNFAIALSREKKYKAAIDYIESINDPEILPMALALKASSLNSLQRYEEAISFSQEAITRISSLKEVDGHLSDLHAELGHALWEQFHDKDETLPHAYSAISYDKTNKSAMRLIRKVNNSLSPNSSFYDLMVRGKWYEPFEDSEEIRSFYTSYEVVADSIEEALSFIIPFKPELVRSSLVIEEVEHQEPCSEKPKGVYSTTAYIFFQDE